MQSDSPPPFYPHLSQRFQSLIWTSLDSDLIRTAVFHAERYFAIDRSNHDARHLYATTLLRAGQTYSALHLVTLPKDQQCTGCLEMKAKCCTVLGRHRQARDALEATLRDTSYVSSGASSSSRTSRAFPDEAALQCRSGSTALRGNLPDKAQRSFKDALALTPYIWEAFEGLCTLGTVPPIDEIFPPRPLPVKRAPPEDLPTSKSVPIATGVGFFTPEAANSSNVFRTFKPELVHPQPFRIAPPPGPRDSIATNDSFFPPDNSFQMHRVTRSQPSNNANVPRPLSSADEAGPVPKRLRSTTRQPELKSKTSKSSLDDPSKKARARPALSFANIFSSSGRRSQQTTTSRTTSGHGKSNSQSNLNNAPMRRSTRLLSNNGPKVAAPTTKVPTVRERRRVVAAPTQTRNVTADSDKDDEGTHGPELGYSTSPASAAALSPQSETSPSPSNWTAVQEQNAQEEYDSEMAEYYIYDLVRRYARASRALAMYDCVQCTLELEQLPYAQQHSSGVLAMFGRAHYERQDYTSAERAFKALRDEEPYRLWDMEVYSTLLWHLQRNIDLSFLAQELLNINPQSPQAWIAIGNLFSLQKERNQALTCFRRAIQLDPDCAYAYTLSGHESIDEDLEKAMNFFRSALCADPRHYNAWYGLGTCYLRMSKVRLAEYHYRKSMEIHPKNAVLLGCVGMAVERRGDREAALALFNQAVELSPENALVRYRRAKILIGMRKYRAAVEDLEYLRSATPDESNVVFQLAKVYRLLGDVVKSAQTLAVARDISPKSISKIKKLLETVKDESQMEEG